MTALFESENVIPKHYMIDIETLGTSAGCAIAQIACAAFDPWGEGILDSMVVNVDLADSEAMGFRLEGETLAWWLRQEKAAQDAVFGGAEVSPVTTALLRLSTFLPSDVWYFDLWARGASFEFPILQAAYRKARLRAPWSYGRECCQRAWLRYAHVQPTPPMHTALEDVQVQVADLQEAFRRLNISPPSTATQTRGKNDDADE